QAFRARYARHAIATGAGRARLAPVAAGAVAAADHVPRPTSACRRLRGAGAVGVHVIEARRALARHRRSYAARTRVPHGHRRLAREQRHTIPLDRAGALHAPRSRRWLPRSADSRRAPGPRGTAYGTRPPRSPRTRSLRSAPP